MIDIKIMFTPWNWEWTDFCPTGVTPWVADTNDLAQCFQQICLQLPILILFAIISSYHFGRKASLVVRNTVQIRALYVRLLMVLSLAFFPLFKTYFYLENRLSIYPSDILVSCTECITWIVHFGLLLSLRSHGGLSHRGSLLLGVLWSSIAVLSVVWLRSGILYSYWICPAIVVSLHICYGLTLIPNGAARIINQRNTQEEERQALLGNHYIRFQDCDDNVLGPAQDGVSFLSKLLFYWVNPLIDKGVLGSLKKIDDLFDLPECLFVSRITDRLQKALDDTRSLFRALHRSFGKEFYSIGILKLISDMSGFAGPLLLGGLLKQKTNENTGTDPVAYLYALGLFSASLLSALCSIHFNWRMSIVSMKMRMGLVTAIYRKTLEAKGLRSAKPDILNLMSTDTDRIVNSCISFHSFWSIPFQLFTTLYLLYTQIGLSFLAGVIFAISLIPINRWIALKIGELSQKLMTAKDARVSASSEAISGAKQLKIHAWEDVFINKIEKLRYEEVKYLSKRKYLDALCVYFWATTPVLVSLLTFGVSALFGNILTAATTYTSVALLNMLIGPLNAFPWVLNGLTEAWVSLKRVQEIIDLPNLDLSTYYSPNNITLSPIKNNVVLSTKHAEFEYEFLRNRDIKDINIEEIVDFKLKDLNLDIKKGELVLIEGPVGGGKSTFLSAILGDLNIVNGEIYVQDLENGFGYVSQTPWIQRGSIRDNILWGAVYDESRYKNVLYVCAMLEDLEILGGDHKGIGESGRTLSGGQRARVALARCIYQDKQVYILDDILSALDAHVSSHVVKHCILGFLKNKTRIIVSENKTLLANASQILHIEGGMVSQRDLIMNQLDLSDDDDIQSLNMNKMVNVSLNTSPEDDFDNKSIDSILLDETKETGKLKSSVIFAYWKATSGIIGFLVILFVILMQVSRNLSDAWLAHWVADNSNTSSSNNSATEFTYYSAVNNTNYYLGIYTGLAVSNSILTLIRAFIFAYAGIRAAKYVHTKLLNSVFYTKFQFFDITPLGRILNRFSSDTYTIDDSLPFILNILLAQLGGLIGALAISLYAMPWLALLVVPLCPIYLSLQSRYRYASRDIKRLSSNALSPLYAHFTETLQGLPTIRAMRGSNRFRRNFTIKLEESIRSQLTAAAAQQWLGLRLQVLGAILVGGAGLLSAITSAHATNPSFVGLAISYALSITSLLSGLLNAVAETEQELVAVERVDQYCNLESELNLKGCAEQPFGWPCQGIVSFNNVDLRYRENLEPALSNVSFEIVSCETVGIVGRTGAGKSSILAGLLRITPVSGTISIDCVNISTLPLEILRRRISVVPQEPFLFAGTVRENLDPRNDHLDTEIWNAVNICLTTPLVQSLGGLNGQIDSTGSNLSAGQKQLLCLTRALLKNSKVVCIDEGTANLDMESEIAIQSVLKNAFKTSTVIFIAHRLNGLQNAKRVIVMDKGIICEQGDPKNLGNDKNSMFFHMLAQQKNRQFRE